jgi:hypothetical protein
VTFTKSYNPKPGGEGGRRWGWRGLDRRRGRRPDDEAREEGDGGGAAWIGGADDRRRRRGRKEMAGARPGSASQTTGREGTLVGHESPGQVKLETAAIGSGRRMGEVAARMGGGASGG